MFAATRPSLLKSANPKLFFARITKKIIEDLFEIFQGSLGKITSSICLLKSQRFAFSLPFNVIEIV